jgi:predicted nucleotidyltransferase
LAAVTAAAAAPIATFKERNDPMAKIPKDPEEIFADITDDFKTAFRDDLLSIILYGSAAGADYLPGKSDINLLIILTDKGIDNLDRAIEPFKRWRKRNVATPLFMTRSYLDSSLDSYPVEFLNMKQNHRTLLGEDVLAELVFDPKDLRLQIERELKGKLLLLRSSFLETEGSPKGIRGLIGVSLNAFIAAFKALLYLKGQIVPGSRRDVIKSAGDLLPLDTEVFLKCNDIKEGTDHFTRAEVKTIFDDYLRAVNGLCQYIDTMNP